MDGNASAHATPSFGLARRLALALVGAALVSMLLAFVLYERSLATSLRDASRERLVSAARAASFLIEDHLANAEARYRAVATTPQMRAVLELAHAPTTRVHAQEIRAQQGALRIELLSPSGRVLGHAADATAPDELAQPARSQLWTRRGGTYAVIVTDVVVNERVAGRLLAVERVMPSLLERWSLLCGARLVSAGAGALGEGALTASVTASGGDGLIALADVSREREALAGARSALAWAGLAALILTTAACTAMARSLVRPLRELQLALARIGGGDLETRIGSRRRDEIGEIARDADRMAARLAASHRELERNVDELRRSRAHLARAQETARLGSFELELESGRLEGSVEFWRLFGAPATGSPTGELVESVFPDDREAVFRALREASAPGGRAIADFRVRLPSGAEHFLHAQFQREQTPAARIEGIVQDVSERRRAEEQIRFLAYYDPLTGLGNRALFKETVDLAIPRARRRGRLLGVLIVDVDDFKRVNDTLGHDVGDGVLREVADRIVRTMRELQPGAQDAERAFEPSVARLGGDEFGVLVRDVHEPSALAPLAERLLMALRRPLALGADSLVISASIGIATWPADGDRAPALLGKADAALGHAKTRGPGGFGFLSAELDEVARRRLAIEVRLREAIASGGLALVFQPKAALAGGRIVGFEALARWRDDELGDVSPHEFASVAEQTDLIVALGHWVRERVCDYAREHAALLRAAGARVSFNVSPRELGTGFAREVAETLASHGVDPALLQIEVTETALARDEGDAAQVLAELRALGLSIAVDDFGIGQSSLAVLRQLPVDTLKIDSSFIRQIAHAPDAAALARSIVALGGALGLCVVAEGVEHPAERALLAKWGCDVIQGYLVARPLPADEAFALLRAPVAQGRGPRRVRSA